MSIFAMMMAMDAVGGLFERGDDGNQEDTSAGIIGIKGQDTHLTAGADIIIEDFVGLMPHDFGPNADAEADLLGGKSQAQHIGVNDFVVEDIIITPVAEEDDYSDMSEVIGVTVIEPTLHEPSDFIGILSQEPHFDSDAAYDRADDIVIEDILIGMAERMNYDAIDGAPEERAKEFIGIDDQQLHRSDMNKGDLINKVAESTGLLAVGGEDVQALADKMDYDAIDGAPEEREFIIIETIEITRAEMNKGDLVNKVAEDAGLVGSNDDDGPFWSGKMDYDAIDGEPEKTKVSSSIIIDDFIMGQADALEMNKGDLVTMVQESAGMVMPGDNVTLEVQLLNRDSAPADPIITDEHMDI